MNIQKGWKQQHRRPYSHVMTTLNQGSLYCCSVQTPGSDILRCSSKTVIFGWIGRWQSVWWFCGSLFAIHAPKMSANCKANGLFWVAVIMLVVELLFALLLNQVLVTMVSQTKYSQQEEKVARWWPGSVVGLVVIVLYKCRKKWWDISHTNFMPIRTGENLRGNVFVRCEPGETRCSLSTLAPFHGQC